MGPLFDLDDLRAFLAVADEENLGRAAARLHVSASPLSRRMIQLEARLGLRLFERSRKRLHLTATGREFRDRARALLSHADDIEHAVAAIKTGQIGLIEIGYVPGAMWSGLLSGLIRRMRMGMPDVRLQLHSMRSAEALKSLRQGILDIAFVHTAAEQEDAGLGRVLVHKDAFCLVVANSHDFATGLRTVSPATLQGEKWVMLEASRSPAFRIRLIAACGTYGFVPDISHEAPDIPTVLGLVEAGMGIALLQSAVKRAASSEVSFIPFPNFPIDVKVHMQWRRESQTAVIRHFLSLAEPL